MARRLRAFCRFGAEAVAAETGAIQIDDASSIVEVQEQVADDIVNALRGATIRGRHLAVRRHKQG